MQPLPNPRILWVDLSFSEFHKSKDLTLILIKVVCSEVCRLFKKALLFILIYLIHMIICDSEFKPDIKNGLDLTFTHSCVSRHLQQNKGLALWNKQPCEILLKYKEEQCGTKEVCSSIYLLWRCYNKTCYFVGVFLYVDKRWFEIPLAFLYGYL